MYISVVTITSHLSPSLSLYLLPLFFAYFFSFILFSLSLSLSLALYLSLPVSLCFSHHTPLLILFTALLLGTTLKRVALRCGGREWKCPILKYACVLMWRERIREMRLLAVAITVSGVATDNCVCVCVCIYVWAKCVCV